MILVSAQVLLVLSLGLLTLEFGLGIDNFDILFFIGETIIETRTGSDPNDGSSGQFSLQFFSPDGTSCTIKMIDNPNKDDFEPGNVDEFKGSVIAPCEKYQPDEISSVKITHISGDGWRGVYLKISYGVKSFTCNLGQRIDGNASIEFPCSGKK